jgi:hypothetical protein
MRKRENPEMVIFKRVGNKCECFKENGCLPLAFLPTLPHTQIPPCPVHPHKLFWKMSSSPSSSGRRRLILRNGQNPEFNSALSDACQNTHESSIVCLEVLK